MHHLSNSGNLTTWDLNTFEDSSPGPILPMGNSAIVVAMMELMADNWLNTNYWQS